MEALVKILEVERRSEGSPGPAFCDRSGFVLGSNFLNEKFHEALERVQTLRPDLIPSNVKKYVQIFEKRSRVTSKRARVRSKCH